MNNLAIKTVDLWKIYQSGNMKIEALKGVNIKVKRGTITTLLGKNGAGKTTFLRIAATQLLPTRGEIYVLGQDILRNPWQVRERIAVIPQDARPLLFPSPLEYVIALLVMRGYSFSEARVLARESLTEVGVPEEYWHRTTWELSGGYKRRVLLAAVMSLDADIIFLDEPSIGLDPLARRELWTKISKLRDTGKTVLLTTHYMEEAETLSDHIIIIHNGKVLKEGSPSDLMKSFPWKYKIEVTNKCSNELMTKLGKVVGKSPPYIIYMNDDVGRPLELLTINDCKAIATFTGLEDIFISLVGEKDWIEENY